MNFKDLHKQMIDSLLEPCGLTQEVRFVYTGQKFEYCPNCIYDKIGDKSSNNFKSGGPMHFHNGSMCPMCGGKGKSAVKIEETQYMMVEWNSKGWAKMASNAILTPDVMIQTMCKIDLLPKVLKVSHIEIIDIEGYGIQRFKRHGDPEPCGFNSNNYILTMWKKA